MIQIIITTLIVGAIYTIGIGLRAKGKKQSVWNNIYFNGVIFTIILFVFLLISDAF